jgi:YD repeat-containing protein
MKFTYNSEGDKLHILFRNAPIAESETHRPDLTLDYDQRGRLVSLELSSASEHIARPRDVEIVPKSPDGPVSETKNI